MAAISAAIGLLEDAGILGHSRSSLIRTITGKSVTPQAAGDVLPQDRIIPFLGGGPLLRSSTLPDTVAWWWHSAGRRSNSSSPRTCRLQFLQVTTDPMFVFRVYEKIVLRIKEPDAIVSTLHRSRGVKPRPMRHAH